MATGTCIYTRTLDSSQPLDVNFTTIPLELSLSSGSIPVGATLTSAQLQLVSVNGMRTDVTFSTKLRVVSGTQYTVGTGAKFSTIGTQTATFPLSIPAGLLSAMAGAYQLEIVFQGGSGSGTTPIFNLPVSSTITVSISYQAVSATVAPTNASVAPTVAESQPTLTWSGAAAGILNPIVGYEIQYADSANGSTWGSWTALKTVDSSAASGTTTVALPSTRGNYRKYRMRTLGEEGEPYNSSWKETNMVRRNVVPLGPTVVTASPSTFVSEPVSVVWSGASSTTSSIKGFMIAKRDSSDGTTYGGWSVLNTINLAASGGNYSVTLSTAVGTYTQFGIWTIDTLDVYSMETVSNAVFHGALTTANPPSTINLTPSIVETTLSLSWSGSSGTPGNAITGYELQYSESNDGVVWGEWLAFTVVDTTNTSGSYSGIAPPATRGAYKRFRVRTRGSAGATYYSAWALSNTAQKNVLAQPPSVFTALPSSYYNSQISLTWSGTTLGTSSIKNYIIQQSTSTDGVNWGSWSLVTTVIISTTSGSCQVTPSSVDGMRTRYRIAVTDVLDAVSAYTTSNMIQRMSVPETPIIVAPKQNSSTYDTTPRILIKTGGTPDGRTQKVCVRIDSGQWYDSVNHTNMFSVTGMMVNGVSTIFVPGTLVIGAKTLTVRCENDAGAGGTVTRQINILPNPFDEITENMTIVKASHINNMRIAVEHLRNYYNLANIAWGDTISEKRSFIRDWPYHINEIRTAIEGIIAAINSHDNVTKFDAAVPPWISMGNARPRADVMAQITSLIMTL